METSKSDSSAQIPYFAHEGMMVRLERTIKRLWITTIILIVLLVVSNLGWLFYEGQFERQTIVTQDVNTKESPAYVNGTGALTIHGESTSSNNSAACP